MKKPMQSATVALLAGSLLVSGVACVIRSNRAAGDETLISGTITHAGLERSYLLVDPVSVADRPRPLVLALHGGGGDAERMCTLAGGVQELALSEGFLAACPEGVEGHWNDGRDLDRYRAHAEDIDDVGFLLALVSQLSQSYEVDPQRIYVTGMSNGGKMSLRLACEASDTFAAAAAIIASLPADLDCRPTDPISILIMNGTEDPLVPWGGGQVRFLRQELGGARSTPDTVAFWVAANGCDPAPQTRSLPDVDPDDKTRIKLARYAGCDAGTSVVLYTVEGGGHTWPGGLQYAPSFLIGRVSRDLHAGEAIWGFFRASAR